jgi:hypothetical protein
MVRSHAALITGNGLLPCCRHGHRSAAPEATEAATAAPRRIARTPTHGHEPPMREAKMAAFAKSWRRGSRTGTSP